MTHCACFFCNIHNRRKGTLSNRRDRMLGLCLILTFSLYLQMKTVKRSACPAVQSAASPSSHSVLISCQSKYSVRKWCPLTRVSMKGKWLILEEYLLLLCCLAFFWTLSTTTDASQSPNDSSLLLNNLWTSSGEKMSRNSEIVDQGEVIKCSHVWPTIWKINILCP